METVGNRTRSPSHTNCFGRLLHVRDDGCPHGTGTLSTLGRLGHTHDQERTHPMFMGIVQTAQLISENVGQTWHITDAISRAMVASWSVLPLKCFTMVNIVILSPRTYCAGHGQACWNDCLLSAQTTLFAQSTPLNIPTPPDHRVNPEGPGKSARLPPLTLQRNESKSHH